MRLQAVQRYNNMTGRVERIECGRGPRSSRGDDLGRCMGRSRWQLGLVTSGMMATADIRTGGVACRPIY